MDDPFNDVRDIIVETLGLDDQVRDGLKPTTPLFGAMPELDSLAVVTLAAALEQHFDFQIQDTDFSAEVFDTIGSLSDYVSRSRPAGGGSRAISGQGSGLHVDSV